MTIPVKITVNGRRYERERRAAAAARSFPPRSRRPHRNQGRLRHQPVRLVHGARSTASRRNRAPAWRCRPTASSVTTIEGLAPDGTLHPLQERVLEHARAAVRVLHAGNDPGDASSCCEPTRSRTDDEIRHGLEGNMCRCTGYQNIVRAVREAAATAAGTGRS